MMQPFSRSASQQVSVRRTVVVEEELQQKVIILPTRVVDLEDGLLLLLDVPLPISIGNLVLRLLLQRIHLCLKLSDLQFVVGIEPLDIVASHL